MTKPRLDSFREKISPEQTEQLIDWLTDHTYSEVAELIAVEPPDGFALEVSIPTICRFHKAHYNAIARKRQDKLSLRSAEQDHYADTLDEFYRNNLNKGTTLCLQERLYEFLSRPIETIDDLKKLAYVCKEVKNLEIPLDPQEELMKRAVKELSPTPLDRLIPSLLAKVEALRASEQKPESPDDAPANEQAA